MQTRDDLIINIQIKKLRATYISAEIDKEAFYRKLLKQIKAHAELMNRDVFICYLILIYCVHLSIL